MLKFAPAFHPDSADWSRKNHHRILGGTPDGELLMLVNRAHGCSIDFISPDNKAASLLFFHKYTDFVSAATSPNRQLLHVTFRVRIQDSFRFVAVLYSVANPGIFKEIKSDVPVDAIFLDPVAPAIHSLVQVAGSRFTLFHVSVSRDKIVMEPARTSVAIRNLIYMQLDRSSNTLWVISDGVATTLHELSCSSQGIATRDSQHIQITATSVLPSEVALEPTISLVLPFYKSNHFTFFLYRYIGNVCFIQQLFEGVDSACAFSVSIYPRGFNRTIFVPGVGADLPLCFFGDNAIVAVFIPNFFLCVIHLAKFPPLISVLPKRFSASVCGRCCANMPIENHIIDLDSADVFSVAFDFSATAVLLPILTKTGWEVITQVCAGTGYPSHFANFFQMIQIANDPALLTNLLRQLFDYIGGLDTAVLNGSSRKRRVSGETASLAALLKLEPIVPGAVKKSRQYPPGTLEHLVELDEEFPAADGGSRRFVFRHLVDALLCRRDSRTIDLAVKRAFQEMHRQNEAVLVLREGLDLWARTFKPSQLEQLRLGVVVQTETVAGNFPAVPCLREELGLFVGENGSDAMARILASARLARPVLMSAASKGEYLWWQDRLGDWNQTTVPESSSSYYSARLSKSGSVDSRMLFDLPLGATLALGDEQRIVNM
jgi:hypothetical protein